MATNSDFLTIASLFGVGQTSVWRIFHEFIEEVIRIFKAKHIRLPNEEEFKRIAIKFERKYGFPMSIGAIDGTHVPIKAPKDLTTDFYNFNGFHSILCLAICDADAKIYWLKSVLPGRCNDSGVFSESEIFDKFKDGTLLPFDTRRIGEVEFHFIFLETALSKFNHG